MPDIRTMVTEIVTGLAITGQSTDVEVALREPPASMLNVSAPDYQRLRAALRSGVYGSEFRSAWANGLAFLQSCDCLRGRSPVRVEWRGPAQTPGYDAIPADLRVDHVYLISCKYMSRVICNGSPGNLFEACLSERGRRTSEPEWYIRASEAEYQIFYERVAEWAAGESLTHRLPARVRDLDRQSRDVLRELLSRERRWPAVLQAEYVRFSHRVAEASAAIWRGRLRDRGKKEMMLWRLLRLAPAPYFVLGDCPTGPMRVRIMTPWDWRQAFSLRRLEVAPNLEAGQPEVKWAASVVDRRGFSRDVDGHIEVRWSHGRFCGHCEAKAYLDTPFEQVPGYSAIS